ncbi:hypothetical protein RUM44_009415 [Polyplax serrata]|uniref:Tower domain-containing protein n=1 Tax=Polyplax serrata TaxID=468196 RepID=A0ABR1ASL9_POLSC
MRDGVHIKLFTNSTRRIRWDAKLGFQKNPGSIRISLDSAVPEGGPISRVDVIVVRVYPTLYSERTSDGRRIVRNRRAEERVDAEYKRLLEQRMEKIYSDVRTEMKLKGKNKMEECLSQASPSMRNRDAFNKEILEKVEEKLRKDSLNRRNVSELLKAKVVDLHKPNFGRPTVLSIWNPNEDVIGLLTEGKSLTLMNVIVSNFIRTSNHLQINATRQTMYKLLDRKSRYPARRLTPLDSISTGVSPVFGEIDLVGIVISVKDISHSSSVSQIVYLADLKFNFAGLSFWGSCKDNGWDNVLVCRRVVACSNLCWKVGEQTNREVPVLQVKETAFFTENPRTDHLKEGVDKLKEGLPKDLNSFICECEEKLLEKLHNPSLTNTSRNFEQETLCIQKQSQSEECSSSNVKQPESSSSMPKQFEKVQRSGRPSNSPFRWLPYKNV